MATEWIARPRQYEADLLKKHLLSEPTSSHPLKAITITEVKKVERRGTPVHGTPVNQGMSISSGLDPLSMADPLSASLEGTDPLSVIAAKQDTLPTKSRSFSKLSDDGMFDATPDMDSTFEPWAAKKSGILSKYTTSEKLSITTSFLSASDKERVVIKTQATVSDKVKNRLEQLDDFEEGSVKEMLNLSQQDYVNRIDELNQALIQAWDLDQRVKSLKIAIQCSKLLADTSVLQFYPSKFVLVTDILDTFGRLVFSRLKDKAQYIPKGSGVPVKLPENFTPDQVPESAKETCRNWFFKIASIRELIPRLYVEAALLKCYNFLNTGEYSDALLRLSNMTAGIGDPLVAVYARCYLCRVGIIVAPKFQNHLMICFNDFLATYSQLQSDSVQNSLAVQKLELPKYLTLFSPALDWILQCIAHKASEKTLLDVLEKCKTQCNSALLLNSIMSAFQPEYIANRALQFTELIKECEETGFPKHLLYRTLGLCLVMADPPSDQRLGVLNDVWKVVMKLKQPADYISCAEVWIEYVVKHFGKREVNTILADVIKHMMPDRAFEEFYPQLHSIVSKILVHIHDFSLLFSLDKFLPFVDMFQKESVKVDVCKSIMESFVKYQLELATNDPVVINALMYICKTMHDSVNALTLDDERRQISNLISGFVRKVSFGRDFEQQLSFYVEARSSFTNLDSVLVQLIQNVNNLSMETRQIVRGNHSRKTASFVRACAAYCFITIPSLHGLFSRLQLYLVSGQTALLNQCLSQGDAFFKAAISLLPDVPRTLDVDGKIKNTEPLMVDYILNFLSTLLVIPDNPEAGVLYLMRGLLNVLQNYQWEANSDAKVIIYTRCVAMLSAMCQDQLPYHVDKVDSNDALYGGDPKFIAEVNSISSTLLDEILSHLKMLSAPNLQKRQGSLALELFNTVIAHGDLTQEKVFTLASNLWGLAQKNGQADVKQVVRTLDYVKRRSNSNSGKPFSDLASKMQLETRA
ncbi:VPS35 endosomal protein-sorting factor-like [Liolophura sinensis]|uniref:VPS35 endosomal protein-sorting factor-like n=1 Tax=Liolophura sinensis TaxID=3198878 RepID=UPI003158024C